MSDGDLWVGRHGGCPVLHGFRPLDQDQVEDPSATMSFARREAPVFYVPDGDYFVITQYGDVHRALNDPALFSSAGADQLPPPPPEVAHLLPEGYSLEKSFGSSDPPVHTRLRRLVQPAFSVQQATVKEAEAIALANSLIDDFVADGRVDLADAYCKRIPVRIICSILGAPERDVPRLYDWAIDLLRLVGGMGLSHEERVRLSRGQAEFETYLRALIDSKREQSSKDGDLISKLLLADRDGDRLSDDEILGAVTSAVFAGSDTAAGTMADTVWLLLEDRARWEAVLADRSLIPAAIDETMRHSYVARMAQRKTVNDTVVGGCPIPAGSRVMLHLWSTGHDEAVFDAPERWDMRRSNRGRHLGFGSGPHFCPGMPLAKMEMRAAINVLMDRLPSARLVPDKPMQHSISPVIPNLLTGPTIEWDL